MDYLLGEEIPNNENSIRTILQKDLQIVNFRIESILTGRISNNLRIQKANYLDPFIEKGGYNKLPLSHKDGEFQYFINLLNVLEYALTYNSIPRSMLPENAPSYISNLVKD